MEFLLFLERCNQTLQATEVPAVVSIPNYPSAYDNNVDCFWIIRASSSNAQVELVVTSFVSERCCDYLRVSFHWTRTKALAKKGQEPYVS